VKRWSGVVKARTSSSSSDPWRSGKLLVRGGQVYDTTGRPSPAVADLLIDDGEIVAVALISPPTAQR
jgi:hypothetical protein